MKFECSEKLTAFCICDGGKLFFLFSYYLISILNFVSLLLASFPEFSDVLKSIDESLWDMSLSSTNQMQHFFGKFELTVSKCFITAVFVSKLEFKVDHDFFEFGEGLAG